MSGAVEYRVKDLEARVELAFSGLAAQRKIGRGSAYAHVHAHQEVGLYAAALRELGHDAPGPRGPEDDDQLRELFEQLRAQAAAKVPKRRKASGR